MIRRALFSCAFVALGLVACGHDDEPTSSAKPAPPSATTPSLAAKPALAAASSSAPILVAPTDDLQVMIRGTWAFKRFDLDDAPTAAKWLELSSDDKAEILSKAPQARLIIRENEIQAKLAGAPDWKSSYTFQPDPLPGTVVIKTDDGRKRFSFVTRDLMRVEEIDNTHSMVTLFRRVEDLPAAASTSASASAAPSTSTSTAPSTSASAAKSK